MTTVEGRYRAAEAEGELKQRRRARRQRVLLLVLVDVLVLGIGVTAAVDLRRLRTPQGTALRWTQAAVFGQCKDYRYFSVSDPSVVDSRSAEQQCRDLRASTEDARLQQLKIGLALGPVTVAGRRAEVEVRLTRDGSTRPLRLHLVQQQGRWRVVRDSLTCGLVGCP